MEDSRDGRRIFPLEIVELWSRGYRVLRDGMNAKTP